MHRYPEFRREKQWHSDKRTDQIDLQGLQKDPSQTRRLSLYSPVHVATGRFPAFCRRDVPSSRTSSNCWPDFTRYRYGMAAPQSLTIPVTGATSNRGSRMGHKRPSRKFRSQREQLQRDKSQDFLLRGSRIQATIGELRQTNREDQTSTRTGKAVHSKCVRDNRSSNRSEQQGKYVQRSKTTRKRLAGVAVASVRKRTPRSLVPRGIQLAGRATRRVTGARNVIQ